MSDEPSGWAVGWAFFAAMMLMMVGVFQMIEGVVAIAKDDIIVTTPNYVFSASVTRWGWIHLILGGLILLVGVGILRANLVARSVAVVLAALSAIANFAWLPYQPIWSITIIAVNIAVIWALTAHGRDIEATY